MPASNNEPLPSDGPAGGTSRLLIRVFLWLLFAIVGLMIFGSELSGIIELGVALLLGWVSFCARTLPRIGWNWAMFSLILIGYAILLAGTHYLLGWFTRTALVADTIGARRWKWRWTWCGGLLLGLGFCAGMSVGGIMHQAGWMAGSPEPMFERRGVPLDAINLRHLDTRLQMLIASGRKNLSDIRREISLQYENFGSPFAGQAHLLDCYQVLLIVGADGGCDGFIIFPRDAKRRVRFGGLQRAANSGTALPDARLHEVIRQQGANLVSL